MANFPPTNSPKWEKWERLADDYKPTFGPEYADGGRDSFRPAGVPPIRRWQIVYSGLTLAEAAILDNWHAANEGAHLTFTFTDRDATAYGGVRCIEYERGHTKLYVNSQFRRITLEDRP